VVEVVTFTVEMVNVAVVAPLGTETELGTLAVEDAELDKVTDEPPDGAGPDNVTVPVDC
jgi:hypothetical protein